MGTSATGQQGFFTGTKGEDGTLRETGGGSGGSVKTRSKGYFRTKC